jgi:hypothetical protein
VSKTGHNGEEHFRVFCIPEKTTKDVRDRAILKPFYLVAGTYETHDEAILRARALLAITREKKFYGFHPEVWSVRQPVFFKCDEADAVSVFEFMPVSVHR